MPEWTPTLGALTGAETTTFRVWAPDHHSVDLILETAGAWTSLDAGGPARNVLAAVSFDAALTRSARGSADVRALTQENCGYWSGTFAGVGPGTLYRYRLDGDDEQTFPDPASRFQPAGVHGSSQVIDPSAFTWSDAGWQPPSLEQIVFYELHVGTFTPEGTFRAAIERLPYLRDLGVSAIELMPVGDFAGNRNWGYDGVAIFAPARCYGAPGDLQALVDAAHAHGLAVFLDVVYNHFGPDGAYATAFSEHYFTDRHSSPWGRGVNLDGPHNEGVRRFFIENALHWVGEYHVDGLRLDATHAIQDESAQHFLAELTRTVREQADRPVLLVAEDHRNLAQLVEPVEKGGFGLDAVWADDFHHQVRVHAAHESEGYFADFSGTVEDLAATLRQGWFFTGQHSQALGEPRGTDPSSLDPQRFVICIQNHDQIGNRADGSRLSHDIDAAVYRAASTLLLLAPQTPLLFMGQEWAASTPFLFFTNHHEELGRRVTEGRREEFRSFAAFRDPRHRARIPDPQEANTFERSRLLWHERERAPHAGVRQLYRRLLALRRSMRPVRRGGFDVHPLDPHTIAVSWHANEQQSRLLVVARLSGPAGEVSCCITPPAAAHVVLTTEDEDVVVDAMPIDVERGTRIVLRFARPGAIVLGSRLAT
jgi:maltooligosyltrehalose trehalohydrolase